MKEWIIAIGLMFFLEGLLYGGFPHLLKRLGVMLQQTPQHQLRMVGFAAMALGLLIVFVAH